MGAAAPDVVPAVPELCRLHRRDETVVAAGELRREDDGGRDEQAGWHVVGPARASGGTCRRRTG